MNCSALTIGLNRVVDNFPALHTGCDFLAH